MRKNFVQHIIMHIDNLESMRKNISQFHADIIEQRIMDSELSPKEKSDVINQILCEIKKCNNGQ